MKARITKLKGGPYPDGFFVEGDCLSPRNGYNCFVKPIIRSSNDKHLFGMDWFLSGSISRVAENETGFIFIANKALWHWCEIFKDTDGKWKRDSDGKELKV